ncbi:RNA polymerase sigma factor [Nonomuraea salmonea]|uniref:RNA polymerase sigma factor n=1 Tax=Nonomuraea salmonea TaxID=46181 RepID=A0ABV5NVK2_9ACTN
MSGFGEPADGELVVLAQQGDAGALGTLLARHRGGMLAVALSVMHDPGESEDAVQDASLTALARIGDLRDPDAVGPWLRMIVRNLCRKRLRARQAIPVGHLTPPERAADPQEALERHAQRDWIWHAVGRLSPPLRTVTLLRYFSSVTRYEEIAAVCGVPVGTVRRRLHEARGMLARTLPGTWDGAHGDAAVAVAARRREADELIAAGHQGTFRAALRESWWPDVEIAWGNGRRTRGIEHLARVVDVRMGAGTRQRVAQVAASADVVVWETEVFSPAEAGPGCAPWMGWLLAYEGGRVRRVRMIHRAA